MGWFCLGVPAALIALILGPEIIRGVMAPTCDKCKCKGRYWPQQVRWRYFCPVCYRKYVNGHWY